MPGECRAGGDVTRMYVLEPFSKVLRLAQATLQVGLGIEPLTPVPD